MSTSNNSPLKYELIVTRDQSHTIQIEGIGETMHSTFGAIEEANEVYIKNGILRGFETNRQIRVLEVGLGTGLNAFLSLLQSELNRKHVYYVGVEPEPIPFAIIEKLNYMEVLGCEVNKNIFHSLHQIETNQPIILSEYFTFVKHQIDIRKFNPNTTFDVILFDPFSPEKAPDLWNTDVLGKMYKTLNSNGIFCTYCAKGVVKRGLISLGFKVSNPPGPTGKREITVAQKN